MTDRASSKDTVWTDAAMPAVAPLGGDQEAELCVVGAGIAGLTAAYLLAKEGRRVVVLDDGAIGGGESGLTTGHLSTALDRRWAVLEGLHSPDRIRLAAESHTKEGGLARDDRDRRLRQRPHPLHHHREDRP